MPLSVSRVRRAFRILAVSGLVLGFGSLAGRAALDVETGALPASGLELVVVETANCVYCAVFRRDVAPHYERSERARSVPMRFVDFGDIEAQGLTLREPVTSVPTVLIMQSRAEAGRIAGYVGPENFFHSINYLLSTIR